MGGQIIVWLLLVGATVFNFLIERHAKRRQP